MDKSVNGLLTCYSDINWIRFIPFNKSSAYCCYRRIGIFEYSLPDRNSHHCIIRNLSWLQMHFPSTYHFFVITIFLYPYIFRSEPVSYTHLTLPTNREV